MGILWSSAASIVTGRPVRTMREFRLPGGQRESCTGELIEENVYQMNLKRGKTEFETRFRGNTSPLVNIKDNFSIVGFLCSGAWGSVYKVTNLNDRTKCALKVMKKECFRGDRTPLKKVVINEKRLQWALVNQFCVPLFSAYQDSENLYLVMEFAKYGELERFCRTPNTMSENTIRIIVGQIILGLEYLHFCGVIYRDLKPENILVFRDGYLKLGDFGLARPLKGRATTFAGTPEFMAPEMQGPRSSYGLEVDYWALGIVMYQLFYFDHPFSDGSRSRDQLFRNIKERALTFPGVRENEALRPRDEFLKGLLDKDPRRRLGIHGGDLKKHEYFDGFSFFKLQRKQIKIKVLMGPVRCEPVAGHEFLPEPGRRQSMNYFDSF
ncbi:cAMP-dependent protein kinase catalytic subunit gamma-like [Galendromus occidentalis]|uniref:cAMP-dependent protein kinase catalytic subunit gamma-like n=1 Tax=Galendromus occidentalis TaxID=34638 RepID=A0AAJ6QWE9_9ACAR|nr:cAMP-dependent protein kinase catalytic subunit gamma-like [Galendromus occidentalis]